MADDSTTSSDAPDDWRRVRYEYRVWGKHRKAHKALAKLADAAFTETAEDCYLIVDDMAWNAKVRDNRLKLKHLLDERKGFEMWGADRYKTADDTPTPFDAIFDALNLDRPQRGKSYDIERAVSELETDDIDVDVKAVFVAKERQRYRIGDLSAEVTDIEIVETGEVLHTLSIEGEDLKALVQLRKELGLKDEPNVPVHQIIEELGDDS